MLGKFKGCSMVSVLLRPILVLSIIISMDLVVLMKDLVLEMVVS